LADPKDRLAHVLAKLRERGYRVTPQRRAILDAFVASEEHPTVEQIFRIVSGRFPNASIATVYKTVAALKEIHEVLELEFSQESNRYDARRPYPHPHVVCTGCGRVLDPELSHLPAIEDEITRRTGFRISSHRLDFYGLCPSCQEEDARGAEPGGP
jgi:Fur family peroxide stress response transcriptional regulator